MARRNAACTSTHFQGRAFQRRSASDGSCDVDVTRKDLLRAANMLFRRRCTFTSFDLQSSAEWRKWVLSVFPRTRSTPSRPTPIWPSFRRPVGGLHALDSPVACRPRSCHHLSSPFFRQGRGLWPQSRLVQTAGQDESVRASFRDRCWKLDMSGAWLIAVESLQSQAGAGVGAFLPRTIPGSLLVGRSLGPVSSGKELQHPCRFRCSA